MSVVSTAASVPGLDDPYEYRAAYSDDFVTVEDTSETFRTAAEAQRQLAHVNDYVDPPFAGGWVERRVKAAGWERIA